MSENKKALNSLSWYHANKHKIIINKEKRRLNQKAWYKKNKEKVLADRKQNYKPHPREAKYKLYHYHLNKKDIAIRRIEKINADKSSKIFYIKRSDIIGH